ncbi:MAG: polysaccharide deacetylase family protein [Candidatus Levyibacteriota bacterium]
MRIPVLTYHSMAVNGNEYHDNDHVALGEDLRILTRLGYRIVSLDEVVTWRESPARAPTNDRKLVAISFDDGPDFDYHDLPHPTFGMQRSMLNLLHDFRDEAGTGAQPGLHATSFVIVSPEARRILDSTCMVGRDWWRDSWWEPAIRSGLLGIANHSWDHNHPTLAAPTSGGRGTGTFTTIDHFDAAEDQIARASRFLHARAENPAASLFAYPYGQANDYLIREYLPRHGERIGIRAAFACAPTPVTEASDPWNLPRYVNGSDWRSPGDFITMLRDSSGS